MGIVLILGCWAGPAGGGFPFWGGRRFFLRSLVSSSTRFDRRSGGGPPVAVLLLPFLPCLGPVRGVLCLAVPFEAFLEVLPDLGLPRDLVASPLLFAASLLRLGCLWVSCLKDPLGFFPASAPLVVWYPFRAMSSSI